MELGQADLVDRPLPANISRAPRSFERRSKTNSSTLDRAIAQPYHELVQRVLTKILCSLSEVPLTQAGKPYKQGRYYSAPLLSE